MKTGSFGLIVSNITADLLASINLLRISYVDIISSNIPMKLKAIFKVGKNYFDFPLYSASQNLINSISSGLPVLLLTKYYGLAIAGSYAFGMNILQAPMRLVLIALRQVLFQKACEYHNEGKEISLLYIRTLMILSSLVIIPTIILILWGPQIFVFIFGERWRMAGLLARSLIIWIAVAFCNLPAVLFARIIRIQRFVFFYDLILLIIRLSVLIIGGNYLSAMNTVMIFAISGAIMNSFLILWVGRSVLKHEEKLNLISLKDLLK